MTSGPYSFEKMDDERSSLRKLAVPALIAACISATLTFFFVKKLRTEPEAQKKSDWVVNWVELTDFKKVEAPKTKELK